MQMTIRLDGTFLIDKKYAIERVHLTLTKLLLKLKATPPSSMIYGEFRRYPMGIDIQVRMISYWSRLIMRKEMID
jgi:hypothetical protein